MEPDLDAEAAAADGLPDIREAAIRRVLLRRKWSIDEATFVACRALSRLGCGPFRRPLPEQTGTRTFIKVPALVLV